MRIPAIGDVKFAFCIVPDHTRVRGFINIEIQQSIGVLGLDNAIEHVTHFIVYRLVFILNALFGMQAFQSFIIFPILGILDLNFIQLITQSWKIIFDATIKSNEFCVYIVNYGLSGLYMEKRAPPPKNGSIYRPLKRGTCHIMLGISFDFPPLYLIIGFINVVFFMPLLKTKLQKQFETAILDLNIHAS